MLKPGTFATYSNAELGTKDPYTGKRCVVISCDDHGIYLIAFPHTENMTFAFPYELTEATAQS
jgi:hypothetical protein